MVWAPRQVWWPEDNLKKSALSFHHVGLWYWTQVIKLVKAFIHWATYFIGPISSSERQLITDNPDYYTQ